MKIFFDTEFTGLHKKTTLISIGCIFDNYFHTRFYYEFTDFDTEHAKRSKWLQDHVFANCLFINADGTPRKDKPIYPHADMYEGIGTMAEVSYDLLCVIDQCTQIGEKIEFVSDVCHYDMVLLIDLLTNQRDALSLYEYIVPVCHDINQDIARFYGISDGEAFDKSREEIVKELGVEDKIEYPAECKHNAMYDACVIKAIYDEICRRESQK